MPEKLMSKSMPNYVLNFLVKYRSGKRLVLQYSLRTLPVFLAFSMIKLLSKNFMERRNKAQLHKYMIDP